MVGTTRGSFSNLSLITPRSQREEKTNTMSMADPATFIATWLTPSSLFIFVNLIIGTIAVTSRLAAPKTHHPQLLRSPSLLDRLRSFNLRHYTHAEPAFVSQHEPECTQPQLARAPSLLERVRSFNLSFNKHEPAHVQTGYAQPESDYPNPNPEECTQPQLVRAPSLLERVRSFNLSFNKHEPAHAQTGYAQPESDYPNPNPEEPQLVRTPSFLQRVRSMSFTRLYRSDSVHLEQEDPDLTPNADRVTGNEGESKAEMKKSASERAGSMKSEWGGEEEEEDEGAVERRRPATARTETTSSFREDEEVDAKADDFINRFKKQLRLQRIDSLLRYRDTMRGN